jgi:hypothetical protein
VQFTEVAVPELDRRSVIGWLLKGAVLVPFAEDIVVASSASIALPALQSQPLLSQVRRLVDAMEYLGEPLSAAERERLDAAANQSDRARAIEDVQQVLDPRCLLFVRINPESRVSVERGAAPARLVEHGWRAYLIKVRNEATVTGVLNVESPQAQPVYRPSTGSPAPTESVRQADVTDRWLALDGYTQKPMEAQLSGLELEYRIALFYSRDPGRREAQLGAVVGPATADVGFRNRAAVLFDIAPSRDVTIRVRDENGRPVMASFRITDKAGRVYPARSKRLAPDFFFHEQIYRADGETVRLPAGEFTVTCGRGPEYIPETRAVSLDGSAAALDFKLRRWIDPPSRGWFSGDHHIHAAGCSHYESPTEGVRPEDMMRHVLGEALSVGSVLNWGPSYYHQRQYFEARDNKVSTSSSLIRYDLEVSGFPSSHCGHIVLLRLKNQDYPGATKIEEWPTWDLPILKWAKAQGAVVGFAHSGFGLQLPSQDLPNYQVPPFNSIGANEYIVDVAHDAVDFISAVDTPYAYELNIWYHTLNCGFTTRISGETDFPCITDGRVGGGRSYVHLPQALTYDAWCEGVRAGRSYVSDGLSHLMNFTANGLEAGTGGGELRLERPGTARVSVQAACLLPENAPAPRGSNRIDMAWSPELARVRGTRDVEVEAVLNGRPVSGRRLTADGALRDLVFDIPIERSSWIAVRILGTAHTNPIFIRVGGRPIRASKRSAEWCLKAVDQCWSQKAPRISARERDEAQRAYDVARTRYRQIVSESDID